MAQQTLVGPVSDHMPLNTADETPERGWSPRKLIAAINDMFAELYAAVAGFTVTNNVVSVDRPLKVNIYTVATQPDAAAAGAGSIIYVSDGNAGAACMAVSDGTDWLVVALGSAIAES